MLIGWKSRYRVPIISCHWKRTINGNFPAFLSLLSRISVVKLGIERREIFPQTALLRRNEFGLCFLVFGSFFHRNRWLRIWLPRSKSKILKGHFTPQLSLVDAVVRAGYVTFKNHSRYFRPCTDRTIILPLLRRMGWMGRNGLLSFQFVQIMILQLPSDLFFRVQISEFAGKYSTNARQHSYCRSNYRSIGNLVVGFRCPSLMLEISL